ncbi:MAG: ABC transporter ATP-binding protein [Desulfurivibrionaceae bacterium]|nr:ABC transporter ATP-binding protein [Desulfobulbales bacterium]MDT8334372.1 ABC transporter ATP-binding protein [Desulfurivibrionaceae bacterium]
MDSSFLETRQLCKIFAPHQAAAVQALADIDLAIHRGEFAVLSGPSGSGKTTLLNIIGGLDGASSGTVILDGITVTELAEKELSRLRRDHIGFVFQAYNLIPVLTARENIEYVMRLQGRSHEECRRRGEEVAAKLDIGALLDKLPNQLSGGQQQRVAVARAVAGKPKLILADEPTANLDSKSAANLMDMMQQLNEDEGITIVFSSHDPQVISKAKHSIVLRDGKVAANEHLA